MYFQFYIFKSLCVFSWLLILSACYSTSSTAEDVEAVKPIADTVLLEGKFYTVDKQRSWASAVAIKDGRFLAVGTNDEIKQYIGAETKVQKLAGAMVLPGLHDTHSHITEGEKVFVEGYCDLPDSDSAVTAEELYGIIKSCRDARPDDASWFIGGGWPGGAFPPSGAPKKEPLDKLFPNRPVVLVADSGHVSWVNSKALALAGIDKNTPDPENGAIDRDPKTGKATGTLFESAMLLVGDLVPQANHEQKVTSIFRTLQHANKLGITSIFDAASYQKHYPIYEALEKSGRLSVHLRAALWAEGTYGNLPPIKDLKRIINRYESEGIKTRAVKLMLDGVMEGETAAQLENYQHSHNRGEMFIDPEKLTRYIIELDAIGVQVKMHGYGSRAVREGLNAIEAAKKANGDNGLRHHVDHLAQVHKDDIGRFADIGAFAGFSPAWAYPSSYEIELAKPMLGEARWLQSFPIGSVLKTKATLVAGSDWPVSDMNPFQGLAMGVNRISPIKPEHGVLNESERLSLEDMITIYTINGAKVMHQEDVTGSIELGKFADMVIIDRNIFEVPAEAVRETQVQATYFKGELVYER